MTMPNRMAASSTFHLARTFRRIGLGLSLAVFLTGCASLDPFGQPDDKGPAALPTLPQPTAETPASAEHKRLVAQFGGEYRAPVTEAYLNQVLAKLAAAEDTPTQAYRVTILNTPVVNAFALPSGNLYITRGLLALANDTSEVAAVMAHEIAHVTARHASQRAERERTEALKSRVATAIQSKTRGDEVQADGRLSLASFSRQQELDADLIGVRTIGSAGYDPYGASRFLASLGRSTAMRASLFGGKPREETPDIMSTHPSTPERIARAVATARQFGAPGIGQTEREAWLRAIDGMDFGDDPAEGIVRGRRFVHPKLGFTFEAPERFVLENSAKALLGLADGGAEALRLDSVALPSATTLETYLTAGWIEGLRQSSIETRTVNGLPAALATARSGDWSFRVATIRFGTDAYRLIFATRNLTPAVDRRFVDSIDTFRRLQSDEISRIKPLRISVVTARLGDSIASMAERMQLADHKLENFLLLNGLEKADSVSLGRQYKIVVE
jgi:predicted Zn-dependent protease